MKDAELIDSGETEVLLRCENKQCRKIFTPAEYVKNGRKCPYCGKSFSDDD